MLEIEQRQHILKCSAGDRCNGPSKNSATFVRKCML